MRDIDAINEKLASGEIYDSGDISILYFQMKQVRKNERFNKTGSSLLGLYIRQKRLKRMLGDCGEGSYIQPPFYANWGGYHIHFGKDVYANYGLTCVDDTDIFVGDGTMIGPNVTLATAAHPIHPEIRGEAMQYNKPIHIGKGCWLGAGVVVMPGVTIGDYSVIGAGSVVTKDIPSMCVAFGTPCKKVRDITDEDKRYYDGGKSIKIK